MMYEADGRLVGGRVRLEMLAKDGDSGRSGCPSVYIDENGWVVVQGPEIRTATGSGASALSAGDTRVRIASKVLTAAVEVLEKRGVRGKTAGMAAQSTVVLDGDGYALVQGPEVEHETRSSLVNLLPGETGIRISTEDLTAAAAALQGH
jgi:hypothetical protein